jgi:uroporphyrinogen-III decarboxylase
MMTSRERLLCVLGGGIPDRVPVAPFVQDEYLAVHYPTKNTVDRVVDATAFAEELDFDLMAKHRHFEFPHFLRKSYPNWEIKRSERVEGDIRAIRLEVITPERTLVQEESKPESGKATDGVHSSTSRHLLDTPGDVEVFLKYLPNLDADTVAEMRKVAQGWRSVIGERGVLAPWGWGAVYNVAAELRGIQNLMMDPYEDEVMYEALMNRLTEEMCRYNNALAGAGVECVGLQGHMANSRTVSPEFYRTHVMPYEKRLIAAIHAGGAFSVFHNCGFASTLYDVYREIGMTVWETVSAPPQGDNDLARVKQLIGQHVVLLGNLDQIHFLKTATPAEVAAEARRIMAIGKPGGRYIFSTSDFLEKGTPIENIRGMIEAAKDAGRYD